MEPDAESVGDQADDKTDSSRTQHYVIHDLFSFLPVPSFVLLLKWVL